MLCGKNETLKDLQRGDVFHPFLALALIIVNILGFKLTNMRTFQNIHSRHILSQCSHLRSLNAEGCNHSRPTCLEMNGLLWNFEIIFELFCFATVLLFCLFQWLLTISSRRGLQRFLSELPNVTIKSEIDLCWSRHNYLVKEMH